MKFQETVDIDTFIKSRNGDKKVMQPIRILSETLTRMRKEGNSKKKSI